jgi:geranyl-CoA carboxylase alpha subunit
MGPLLFYQHSASTHSTVLVSEGSPVSKGQLLLVLEAMKMEHPLKAGIDGVIKHIQVSLGDQVKSRQILLEVE